MIVELVSELSLVRVFDRGVPNKESIAFTVNESTNMGRFGVMLGVSSGVGMATPIQDHLYWFGDGYVQRGDWIFLYTGSGNPMSGKASDGVSNLYTCFWGKSSTVLANSQIVPILFRVEGVQVDDPPVDQLQLGLQGDA